MTVIYSRADRIFRRIVTAGALTSLLLLGLIASFLILRSAETFREFGINFIRQAILKVANTNRSDFV